MEILDLVWEYVLISQKTCYQDMSRTYLNLTFEGAKKFLHIYDIPNQFGVLSVTFILLRKLVNPFGLNNSVVLK